MDCGPFHRTDRSVKFLTARQRESSRNTQLLASLESGETITRPQRYPVPRTNSRIPKRRDEGTQFWEIFTSISQAALLVEMLIYRNAPDVASHLLRKLEIPAWAEAARPSMMTIWHGQDAALDAEATTAWSALQALRSWFENHCANH